MPDPLPLDEALSRHRKGLQDNRNKLNNIKQQFLNLADREPDEFKRSMYDRLSQYAKVMGELFLNIEAITTYNASLQVKLEGLRDIIYELEEVKKDPVIQEKIRRLFLDYESRF